MEKTFKVKGNELIEVVSETKVFQRAELEKQKAELEEIIALEEADVEAKKVERLKDRKAELASIIERLNKFV